jgi:hypothetical protein
MELGDLLLTSTLFLASMIVVFEFGERRRESRREQRLLDAIQREYEQFFQPLWLVSRFHSDRQRGFKQAKARVAGLAAKTAGANPDIDRPSHFETRNKGEVRNDETPRFE